MRILYFKVAAQIVTSALLIFFAIPFASAQGMMDDEHHRKMMQRMMGDKNIQTMDSSDLPEPESEGARLLQQFCTQCHGLYGPGLHTADKWPDILERMNWRMQRMDERHMMMGRIEAPSPRQLAAMTDYLQEHSQKAMPKGRAEDLQQTEGGRLFSSVCSRCHALPDPGQHTAREWPSVMERMRRYVSEAGQDQPADRDWEQIVNFLQRNSGVEDAAEERR